MKLPGLAGPSLNPPANFLNPAAERTLQGLFGAFGPLSTVQVVGDVYLDVIAKIDALPEWDGDSTIKQPIETVAGIPAPNYTLCWANQPSLGGSVIDDYKATQTLNSTPSGKFYS